MRLPAGGIGGRAGHHDLEHAPGIVIVGPVGAEPNQLAVEFHADAPAHADDHRLAVYRLEPALEVQGDVLRDEPEALFGPDDGLELRPLGFELLFALDFFALGGFLKVRVDSGTFSLVERQLGKAGLVVDRNRRPVLDRALDVVHADVVAEDGARVRIRELDRGAGEADEGGVRQRVAHVAGEAVDEIVLAAVRLVGDHNDVAAPGEHLHHPPSPPGGGLG